MHRRSLLPALLFLTGCPDSDSQDTVTIEAPALEIAWDPLELTDLAQQAVDLAPAWLQDDLAVSLGRLGDDLQNELAVVLVDLDDPYLTDEVGFAIAHISPEVLDYRTFHPELLQLNAELIYAYDADLEYVEILDQGEPGTDADYYTTASFLVGEDGSVVEKTIDKDLYYWYVVHPRLEDELPEYLDAWSSSSGKEPDEGLFWREFLWDKAADECPEDRSCPLLRDTLAGVETVWEGKQETREDNGAIGELVGYVWEAIDFGAGDERPIQPSRIYTLGAGNCGEHADLSCAAARVGLIPCRNVGARSNDHTWNEFWDDRWVAWEPIGTHVDYFGYYGGPDVDYYSYDHLDNDCDGVTDFGDDTEDHDEDGYSIADGDCDDGDGLVSPGGSEELNGYDDDCDGVADNDLDEFGLDYDGDGWSITDGDCNDLDLAVHPEAEEIADSRDQNCDGVADEGTENEGNTDDADSDGYSIADGDCDDTNIAINPGVSEWSDARDDDCDGLADEGLSGVDYDDDGYTMAEGDCDDTNASVNPEADDPGMTSNNRLYAMTTVRGDTWVDSDLTESYGRPAWLEFQVSDPKGYPVDGAVLTVFGTWSVYGYPDYYAWAAEGVSDLDGFASVMVGKHNKYGYAAYSDLGDDPGGEYLYEATDFIEEYETLSFEVQAPESNAGVLSITQVDLEGDPELLLDVDYQVDSYRLTARGGRVGDSEFYWGSSMQTVDGGLVDRFVVGEANFDAFVAGEPFEAMAVEQASASGELQLELPLDQVYTLVLHNPAVASHMVGTLLVAAYAAEGLELDGAVEPVSARFRIPPQDFMAVELTP